MTTTTATATATVGNGLAVHRVLFVAIGGGLITACGAEGRRGMNSAVRNAGSAAVTCRSCSGDVATAPALPVTAPATCETHKQAAYAPKTVKRGTYVGYPCGCKVWTA